MLRSSQNILFAHPNEIFRKYDIGFKDICGWWIMTYPDDIFTKNPVGKITKIMKKMLK